MVGPEGGITPDEIQLFKAAGAQIVLLGEHVLRSATAGPWAIAAAKALLQEAAE
ncbi:RsmE family RNA methyltransferase [Arcanobacterium hippocoleae]